MAGITVPLRAKLTRTNGSITSTENEFVNSLQYTCPHGRCLPTQLDWVVGQVRGRETWKGEVASVTVGPWQQAWPGIVQPAKTPPLLHIIKFKRVIAGSGRPSRVQFWRKDT